MENNTFVRITCIPIPLARTKIALFIYKICSLNHYDFASYDFQLPNTCVFCCLLGFRFDVVPLLLAHPVGVNAHFSVK